MKRNRFCLKGGALVAGDRLIPNDISLYHHARDKAYIGCNRLWCYRCQQWVRNQVGVQGKGDLTPHLEEVYGTSDWRSLPYMEVREGQLFVRRLYACKCSSWLEFTHHYLRDDDFDPVTDPVLPWRCAGHPVPDLPTELGGQVISADTDWEGLVRKVRGGWVPFDSLNQLGEGPPDWLTWLYAYLLGLEEAEALSDAAADLFEKGDGRLRGMVLYFLEGFPGSRGYGRLVALAEGLSVEEVMQTYRVPEAPHPHKISIFDVLVARLKDRTAKDDELDERTIRIIRKVLLSEARGITKDHLRAIVRADGEWVASLAFSIVKAVPTRFVPLMNALRDLNRPELLAIATIGIAHTGVVPRNKMKRWLKEEAGVDEAFLLLLGKNAERQRS